MNLLSTRTRSVLLSVSLLAPVVAAQTTDATLTPLRVAEMRSVVGAEISPDGAHVAYVLLIPADPFAKDDGGSSVELHVLDVATGDSRPFVTAPSGVSQVAWTPDSAGISFVAKREGDDQSSLYVLPVAGGEARRAFAFDDRGVEHYAFSPDGTRVAVIATGPEAEGRDEEREHGFNQEIYEEEWRAAELWIAKPFDDEAEPANLGIEGHVSDAVWSPDGGRLALTVAPTALTDDNMMRKRIHIVDASSGDVTGSIENPGKLGSYTWRPDGSALAIIAGAHINDGSDARLMLAPTNATGAVPVEMLGERERDEHSVSWLAQDRLLVLGSEGAWSNLDSYGVADGKATDRQALVGVQGPIWTHVSVSADGLHAALVGSTPTHPRELFTFDFASRRVARRTNSNPWLGKMRLAQQEVIRYEARDGLMVEGIFVHPLDVDGPAPLIVAVHGGPEAHLSNGWLTRYSDPAQLAAPRGIASFYPNYRGSTGRGLAYLETSQGDPAGKEFDDVVDGVDHLIERGLVDRDRVGVTGGSYGGYATGWCSTYYSDRFAAGVMFVGISDQLSMLGTSDIPDELYLVHTLKRPWEDWQFFLERSPVYYADKSKTPLLIMHGKEDPRVDPGQSREMYRNLKLRGQAPVRLVEYPGEGHGNRKAAAKLDYSLRMLRWFEHYLTGEGGDPPAWPIDYDAVKGSSGG